MTDTTIRVADPMTDDIDDTLGMPLLPPGFRWNFTPSVDGWVLLILECRSKNRWRLLQSCWMTDSNSADDVREEAHRMWDRMRQSSEVSRIVTDFAKGTATGSITAVMNVYGDGETVLTSTGAAAYPYGR